MSKRESGWYRVWVHENKTRNKFLLTNPSLMKWDSESELFHAEYWSYDGSAIHKVDPQMVMTPEGQIVYNHPEHDPLYNTRQEG